MTHELKTWTAFYHDVAAGIKKFELRKNDRDFKVGDLLILEEWNTELKEYTGNSCVVRVVYILQGGQFGLEEGYVIMSISGR